MTRDALIVLQQAIQYAPIDITFVIFAAVVGKTLADALKPPPSPPPPPALLRVVKGGKL